MTSVLRFNRKYFALTIALLAIEILIAIFAHDQIIRPYIGDLLVVVLIYCFIKSFLNIPVLTTAIAVLIFSYLVELLQYFQIVNKLGLRKSAISKVIIGTSFEWIDIFAYTCGIIIVLYIENLRSKKADINTS